MSPRIAIRDASGLTLIETLVAVLVGVVVTGATFAILNLSLNQSTRIADRVSADQRGRLAMEKLLLELHSSCVSVGLVPPILEKSTATNIKFLSETGSGTAFTTVTEHEVKLEGGTLYDVYYTSFPSSTGKWTFPSTPTTTVTLLTGVSQSANGTAPVFQYFKYEKGQLSATPLNESGISKEEAKVATQVNIRFSVAPESGNNKGDRLIDLSDNVILRLTPATEVGPNEPCE